MEQEKEIKIENHNKMENCNVFLGPTYGGIFALPGSQPVINNYYGKENPKPEKSLQQESTNGLETKDERDKRKEETIKTITKLFQFKSELLGYDNQKRKITNERLCVLFRQCLGLGSHPSIENRETIELIWVLLIDKRNQCFKEPGEGFFRQTILNILGYFQNKGLLCGSPLEIAQSLFQDADTNIAKNVSRGISSNVYPIKTSGLFDFYIERLKNGEI